VTVPGVHHVVARDGAVWATDRRRRAARIDGASGAVEALCEATAEASHFDVDREGRRMFIADVRGKLIAVDARRMSVLEAFDAPGAPQLPMVADNGIACVTGAATGTITIVRPQGTGYASATYPVAKGPHDPVPSADGAFAFIGCAGDGIVAKVRLADGAVVGRFAAGDGPSHIALHPDGTRLYVANTYDGTLVSLSVEGDVLGRAESGRWAHVPRLTPDGRSVFVANFLDDTLSVFDADTLERRAILEVESYPHGLDVSPDGRFVVATGYSSDHVRVFDAGRHVELARIEVGLGSAHTAFTADGRFAYVGCSVVDRVARIDTGAMRCADSIALAA
jgi:YVTN family beta-propeller protein